MAQCKLQFEVWTHYYYLMWILQRIIFLNIQCSICYYISHISNTEYLKNILIVMYRRGSGIYYCQMSELVLPFVGVIYVRYVFGFGFEHFLALALALVPSPEPWPWPWSCFLCKSLALNAESLKTLLLSGRPHNSHNYNHHTPDLNQQFCCFAPCNMLWPLHSLYEISTNSNCSWCVHFRATYLCRDFR